MQIPCIFHVEYEGSGALWTQQIVTELPVSLTQLMKFRLFQIFQLQLPCLFMDNPRKLCFSILPIRFNCVIEVTDEVVDYPTEILIALSKSFHSVFSKSTEVVPSANSDSNRCIQHIEVTLEGVSNLVLNLDIK